MHSPLYQPIIFEYPLNEKMRSWLRVEQLFQNIFSRDSLDNRSHKIFLLHHLGNLLETLERNDIRTELAKDLERQREKLAQWTDVPGVDGVRLSELQQQIEKSITELTETPKADQVLRDDLFLSSVRSRLLITMGSYSFDLPVLHLWLHQPAAQHYQQVHGWLSAIAPLNNALTLQLQLLRQSTQFQPRHAIHGFYKEKIEGDYNLLRLQLNQMQQEIFPQISAHKNYFAIRFVFGFSTTEHLPDRLAFSMTCC